MKMSRRKKHVRTEDFIDLVRSRQRNLVWPDTLVNSTEVDNLLLRGSARPSLVQRIGAWIFGAWYLGIGIAFVDVARDGGSLTVVFVATLWILLGICVFRNGFRRRRPKRTENHAD